MSEVPLKSQEIRQQIVEIITGLRTYGHWMLEDLTKEELLWKPENTSARTIQSYVRHIINAEIFWLKHLEDEAYNYES
ncbi:MAG: DinB family protein, partial [Candidatus Hodarchaeales archaeon]